MAQTQNSKVIQASADKIFKVLADPKSIEIWQVPGDMTGKIHSYDFKVGGTYEMSLFYPAQEEQTKGKSGDKEDRFTAKFIEIIPDRKIVETIYFDSEDESYKGAMTMQITLNPTEGGTEVTFLFSNIPKGINPEDNEAGTLSSLEKLARLAEK